MATDEGSEPTQEATESRLEDLFAMEDEEDEAESDEEEVKEGEMKVAETGTVDQDADGSAGQIGRGTAGQDGDGAGSQDYDREGGQVGDPEEGADTGATTGSSTVGPGTEIGPPFSAEHDDAEILTDATEADVEHPGNGSGTESTAPTRPDDVGGRSDTDSGKHQASNRLTTGITMLDRELEGGIPPGRMLSLVAPPETQSELLVKEMAISRPTVYISTFRPEWEVREELRDHLQKSQDEALLDNELRVSYVRPEDLLTDPLAYIGDLPKGANLIIDSINEFEVEDRTRYVEFLNTAKETLWDTGSVGLFYGIEEPRAPPARSLTLKRSDIVWQLDRSISANEIQTTLVISKFRGGKALTEPVKLVLTDEVQVDLSRDIG